MSSNGLINNYMASNELNTIYADSYNGIDSKYLVLCDGLTSNIQQQINNLASAGGGYFIISSEQRTYSGFDTVGSGGYNFSFGAGALGYLNGISNTGVFLPTCTLYAMGISSLQSPLAMGSVCIVKNGIPITSTTITLPIGSYTNFVSGYSTSFTLGDIFSLKCIAGGGGSNIKITAIFTVLSVPVYGIPGTNGSNGTNAITPTFTASTPTISTIGSPTFSLTTTSPNNYAMKFGLVSGTNGITSTYEIGSVSSLTSTTAPTVKMTKTTTSTINPTSLSNYKLDFGLQQGLTGATGATPGILLVSSILVNSTDPFKCYFDTDVHNGVYWMRMEMPAAVPGKNGENGTNASDSIGIVALFTGAGALLGCASLAAWCTSITGIVAGHTTAINALVIAVGVYIPSADNQDLCSRTRYLSTNMGYGYSTFASDLRFYELGNILTASIVIKRDGTIEQGSCSSTGNKFKKTTISNGLTSDTILATGSIISSGVLECRNTLTIKNPVNFATNLTIGNDGYINQPNPTFVYKSNSFQSSIFADISVNGSITQHHGKTTLLETKIEGELTVEKITTTGDVNVGNNLQCMELIVNGNANINHGNLTINDASDTINITLNGDGNITAKETITCKKLTSTSIECNNYIIDSLGFHTINNASLNIGTCSTHAVSNINIHALTEVNIDAPTISLNGLIYLSESTIDNIKDRIGGTTSTGSINQLENFFDNPFWNI